MTTPVSQKFKTRDNRLTVKGIRPSTEHDALSVWLMLLKVQQMADQRLYLCSITSEALHFAYSFEELHLDIVVLDDTPGLGSLVWVLSSSGVGDIVFHTEFL